jgi:hypothetical protein
VPAAISTDALAWSSSLVCRCVSSYAPLTEKPPPLPASVPSRNVGTVIITLFVVVAIAPLRPMPMLTGVEGNV